MTPDPITAAFFIFLIMIPSWVNDLAPAQHELNECSFIYQGPAGTVKKKTGTGPPAEIERKREGFSPAAGVPGGVWGAARWKAGLTVP
jgi:hypothetical protein